jgi:hypothetical protein
MEDDGQRDRRPIAIGARHAEVKGRDRAHRSRLTAKERADPTWAAIGNDSWWWDFFQARYDADMRNTEHLE